MNSAADLLHRVSLFLLAAARRRGGFLTDAKQLSLELSRISLNFDGALLMVGKEKPKWKKPADLILEVKPQSRDRLELEIRHGLAALSAALNMDGVLASESFSFGTIFGDLRKGTNLTPASPLENNLTFRGCDFSHALGLVSQADAAFRVLAVEFYTAGLVVHFQYGSSLSVASTLQLVSVEDDLGTQYRHVSTEVAGLYVRRGSACFVPAVPRPAKTLHLITLAGRLSIDLGTS